MKRTALLCLPALLLVACGGGGDAASSEAATTEAAEPTVEQLDGSETYRSPGELVDALAEQNIECSDLESSEGLYATAQARCYLGGEETVVQLWASASERDTRVMDLAGLLGGSEIDYCFVLGRGDTGTWSVNAGNALNCRNIASALEGDQVSS